MCLRRGFCGLLKGGCSDGVSNRTRSGLSVGSVSFSKSHSIEGERDDVGDQGSLGLRGLIHMVCWGFSP